MPDGDQQRWLTYAEAGELLGISAQAARMLAKRRGWARRTPNAYGDRARVFVSPDTVVQPRAGLDAVRSGNVITSERGTPNGHDQVNVQPLEQAIELLREQLGIANRRCDRAEQAAATLRAELADLRISEQASANLAEYGTAQAVDLRKRLEAIEQRANDERDRADRAEKRAGDEQGRADQERQRADQAEQRADRERERAESAAQQLAGMEAELVGSRVEAAGLRCKLVEAARPPAPPQAPEPPRTRWRRVLRVLGHTR